MRHTVAIASAKGGVGKSTVSINLAVSLAAQGARVGLLDADIYGPSIPLMMGIRQQPTTGKQGTMRPVYKAGVALMSIGFIAGENAPVVWRGPLLARALQQFLNQVEWGALDYLLIDLPPGTGDVPLTLSQAVILSGALIVTTPQSVALEDVERGIAMFSKVEVDILGIVENMSYYLCSQCDQRHEIFGCGGGRDAAERLGLPFLGALPLSATIRQSGDEGWATPDPLFDAIGEGLIAELQRLEASE
ncbi:MAG: Mrp/NBP35 family ATP-binding protein [Gemmatimonadota bacterium]|nr:Mrp/NBP35 family ATP-binding protein [Gemmatimonadota bacterium]